MAPPSQKQRVAAALPGNIASLVRKTGLTEAPIRRHLRTLRAEGRAHILRYRRTTGAATPYWVAGPGQDAPKPKPYSNAQHCRRHRAFHAKEHARNSPKRIIVTAWKPAPVTPQSWAAALGL